MNICVCMENLCGILCINDKVKEVKVYLVGDIFPRA